MSVLEPDSREAREFLRAYLLDTLPSGRRGDVAKLLQENPAWQQALDRERMALEKLDRSLCVEPSAILVPNVIGQIGKNRLRRKESMRRLMLELAAAMVLIAVGAVTLLPSFSRAREAARRASTANNFKQWGLIMEMYSNEDPREFFPPRSRCGALWTLDIQGVYPEFLTDTTLILPSVESQWRDELDRLLAEKPVDWCAISGLAAKDMLYTGWVIRNPDEARLAIKYESKLREAEDRQEAFVAFAEGVLFRLPSDAKHNGPGTADTGLASEIPVLVENVFQDPDFERSADFHVLFLDGHVETFRAKRDGTGQRIADTFRLFVR